MDPAITPPKERTQVPYSVAENLRDDIIIAGSLAHDARNKDVAFDAA